MPSSSVLIQRLVVAAATHQSSSKTKEHTLSSPIGGMPHPSRPKTIPRMVHVRVGPCVADAYDNEDGTSTPCVRIHSEMELAVAKGMYVARTGHEFRNKTKKTEFTDCRCDLSRATNTLHRMLDHQHAFYGAGVAKLRSSFLKNVKVSTKIVQEKDETPSYTRYTVVLKLDSKRVERYVSYVLCGNDKRCHLFVTANTKDDASRWKDASRCYEELDQLGSRDPRLPNYRAP